MAAPQDVYCTLLVNDGYLPGAMVLAHSLRDQGTKKALVALVTLETVSAVTIEQLKTVYSQVIPVERIINRSPANLYLMDRPDLNSTFTKIALWQQTQFRRIVYIDADVVALRAPEELFARESAFAAAPDVGWPDCFNSGVMALTPNLGDYYALLALAQRGISFDGADQGLLNMHFTNWDRISFTYNCTPSGHYQYVPAYKHFQSSISLIHFIGKDKPWLIGREAGRATGVYEELLGRWWAVYDRHFRPTPSVPQAHGNLPNMTVQQHVHGDYRPMPEITFTHHTQPPPPSHHSEHHQPPPGAPTSDHHQGGSIPARPEVPMMEQMEAIHVEPPPAPRPFLAPQAEWDPMRQPPPTESRPEAFNFPSQIYTMSADKGFFKPPKSYPEPPKDMWYQVPPKSPVAEKPKTVFPWEVNQPKATRVFPEETSSPPVGSPTQGRPPQPGATPLSIDTQSDGSAAQAAAPTTPTIQVTPVEPFVPFAEYSRSNAWDEIPEIDRYMTRFRAPKRGRVQVIHSSEPAVSDDLMSPVGRSAQAGRRESLILTDFPTEIERPSLPVTPAPVRRFNFSGLDDGDAELPPAEGVPPPEDWDPLKKLEELHRMQIELLARGPVETADLPLREVPQSSGMLLPTSEETEVPQTSVSSTAKPLSQQLPLQESIPAIVARQELEDGAEGAGLDVLGPES